MTIRKALGVTGNDDVYPVTQRPKLWGNRGPGFAAHDHRVGNLRAFGGWGVNTLCRSCEVCHFGFEAPGKPAREANTELGCSSNDEGK